MTTPLRWMVALACALVVAPAMTEAQSVTVQGQVQVQPYGQPYYGQPYAQPPPGYGQPYAQPQYGQPYGQPYAPTYVQPQRQVTYVDQETSVKGLWIPGIVIFGVSYVLTGSMGILGSSADYRGYAWIPLAGPWMMLGEARTDDEVTGALVGGVAQLAGLTMFVLGLTLRQTVRVAVYTLERHERAPQLALDLLPTPAGGQLGVTFSHF